MAEGTSVSAKKSSGGPQDALVEFEGGLSTKPGRQAVQERPVQAEQFVGQAVGQKPLASGVAGAKAQTVQFEGMRLQTAHSEEQAMEQ